MRKLSQYPKKNTMGDRLRYFPNPNQDFSPNFAVPSVPQEQIRDSLNELVLRISKHFPANDKNAGKYLKSFGLKVEKLISSFNEHYFYCMYFEPI